MPETVANLTDWQVEAIRYAQAKRVRESMPESQRPGPTQFDAESLPSVGRFGEENVRQGMAWDFLTKTKGIDPDKAEEMLRRG